jgi:hypothetical protein
VPGWHITLIAAAVLTAAAAVLASRMRARERARLEDAERELARARREFALADQATDDAERHGRYVQAAQALGNAARIMPRARRCDRARGAGAGPGHQLRRPGPSCSVRPRAAVKRGGRRN